MSASRATSISWGEEVGTSKPIPSARSRFSSVAIATSADRTPASVATRLLTCIRLTESTYEPRRSSTRLMRRPAPAAHCSPSTCSAPAARPAPEVWPTRSSGPAARVASPAQTATTKAASSGTAQPSRAWCSSARETAVDRPAASAARVAARHEPSRGSPTAWAATRAPASTSSPSGVRPGPRPTSRSGSTVAGTSTPAIGGADGGAVSPVGRDGRHQRVTGHRRVADCRTPATTRSSPVGRTVVSRLAGSRTASGVATHSTGTSSRPVP